MWHNEDLQGKVALITGVGSGIGRSLALALHKHGVKIAGCAVNASEFGLLSEELGVNGFLRAADITDLQSFECFVDQVCCHFDVPDILIANAGVTDVKHNTIQDLPLEVWTRVVTTNLTGTFITFKTVLPRMATRGRGNVVAVTSLLGQKGYGQASDAPYCASKFGIEGLVEVAVAEYKQSGLNINTVFPAAKVRTGFFAHLPVAEQNQLASPDVLNELVLFLAGLAPFSLSGRSINGKSWNEDANYLETLKED